MLEWKYVYEMGREKQWWWGVEYALLNYLFFLAALGLCCCAQASLVAVSGGYSSLRCVGFSLQWLLLFGARALGAQASVVVARRLWSAGSVVAVHGLSCSAACGIFPDQGSNLCSLHWQADS